MKYSLRSLMTFSIRDLALVTVIVTLAVGWCVDHRRMAKELAFFNNNALKKENQMLQELLYEHGVEVEIPEPDVMIVFENGKRKERKFPNWQKGQSLPTSQAPAPNPPKE